MRKTCNINCKFFEDIDLFGMEAEVYFKGKSKRSSTLGKILTIIYGILYAAFFIYKLVRMLKKVDVTFYETTTFTGEIPSLYLDNDMFYGGFGLMDVRTGGTFVDPTVYTANAVFFHQKKVGNTFDGAFDPVELEVCDINKFGKNHQSIFSDKNVDKLYCFKKMDYTIAGHTTYDIYNYFQIFFYPCVNSTENNFHCKPIETIKQLLTYTGVTVKIQDLELTPENYNEPIIPRARELTAPVMSSLYQNINAYFHIISIESDTDIIGFEALSKYDVKNAFKYDVTFIMTRTNSETALIDGDGYCDITIQLTEQVITIKRTYTKLIEALGDVGGLMEFIFSFFRIIASFLTETLYEQSLVNSLFSFDLDKKKIYISERKIKRNKSLKQGDFEDINDIEEIREANKKYKEKDNLKSNDLIIYRANTKRKTGENKNKASLEQSQNSNNDNNPKYRRKSNYETSKNKLNEKFKYEYNRKNSDEKESIEHSELRDEDTPPGKQVYKSMGIINHIDFDTLQFYFCFLCLRKFKNTQNALIDEGMKLITVELDIRNLFRNMLKLEKMKNQYQFQDSIDMSDQCKNKLAAVNKKNETSDKSEKSIKSDSG